jgi:hypothetical protein
VYDWEETEGPDGKLVAKLGGTEVVVYGAREGAPGVWCWEVRFADGQVQTGFAEDADEAMDKGKGVAESFLP